MAANRADQVAPHPSVHGSWYERWSLRDRVSSGPINGLAGGQPCAEDDHTWERATYMVVGSAVVASCVVGTFSTAHDISWRLFSSGNLWEPAIWYATSGVLVLALLPVARYAAVTVHVGLCHRLGLAVIVAALCAVYATLHIGGMFILREWAYGAIGGHWPAAVARDSVLYELRKDVLSFASLTAMFWLAWRPPPAPSSGRPVVSSGFWLRDGRKSVMIDPREVVLVTSAGNYVEYLLTGSRRHLIRSTLHAEEQRLSHFGVARVHRTRLVNIGRVVGLVHRPAGDFELELDTGELVAGSRRYKTAVAAIGKT